MLAVRPRARAGLYLVDCGGDVSHRLMMAGGTLHEVRGLILTHEHIDHVSGFPLLMEKLWLSGRREPLPMWGPAPALRQARAVFESFDTESWTGMPDREEHPVDPAQEPIMFSDRDLTVRAAWAVHSKPVIALRFEGPREAASEGGRDAAAERAVFTYSADTEYCPAVVGLAQGADLLVHEATGSFPGHSSALEAATVAAEAGAGQLVLVHVPGDSERFRRELAEARGSFPQTAPGEELRRYLI